MKDFKDRGSGLNFIIFCAGQAFKIQRRFASGSACGRCFLGILSNHHKIRVYGESVKFLKPYKSHEFIRFDFWNKVLQRVRYALVAL